MSREELNRELQQLGAINLMQIPVRNCFSVPPSFFNTLESDTLQQLQRNSDNFSIPENFLSDLENNILIVTSGIQNDAPKFVVPSGYFSELESDILKETSAKQTPVLSIQRNNSRIKIWASIAASFIIGFLFFNTSEPEECLTFACLLEQSQLSEDDYLQVYDADVADEMLEATFVIENVNFEEGDLIDYLIEEDIDFDMLSNTIES